MAGNLPPGWEPLFSSSTSNKRSSPQPAAPRAAGAPPGFEPLFPTSTSKAKGSKQEVAAPTAGLDLSALDAEIAAKRAEIADREKKIAEAKAAQAAEAKYREEHPILSRLRDALTATSDKKVLTSPEGMALGLKPLKQDLAALESRRKDSVKQGKLAAAPTKGRIALETAKGALRGPIRSVEDIASWAGALGAPGEAFAKGVENLGEGAIKGLGLEEAPELKYSGLGQRLSQSGELVGGIAAFAPLEALNVASKAATASRGLQIAGKAAKAAEFGMAGGMGARQARETMDVYEERTGQQLSPATRAAVQAGGTVIGTAFMLPLKSILSKASPEVAAAAGEQAAGVLARLGMGQITKSEAATVIKSIIADVNKTAVGRTVTKGVLPGAAVVGGMQAGQNLLEATYNPEKRSLEGIGAGVPEAAVMGGLGAGVVGGAVEGLRSRATTQRRNAILEELRRQRETEQQQAGPDYGTFDIVSRTDAGKLQREPVKVVSEPDADGNVTVQRADGTRSLWSLEDLKKSHAPAESIRSMPIPDTLSRQSIADRLRSALGDFAPDESLDTFIRNTADQLGDAVVLGQPERPNKYLDAREGEIMRKRKISEESRIGHSLVVDEARKILNEYTDLVTAPPERPAPKMAGEEAPAPKTTESVSPPRIEEVVQNRAAAMREENARRTAAIDQIANDQSIIDKVGTFEDLMEQNGYARPSPEEIAHLHDAMRLAAERETAESLTGARVEDIHLQEQRQAGAGRASIIEDHLYDPEASARKKLERIDADLEAAGLPKLTEDEVNRYQAVADAIDVFGKKAEQERQAQGRAELGELEAQIKPAAEQPARTAEPLVIERPPAPGRNAELAGEAEAANQRLVEAQARVEQSRAEIDRINAAMEAEQAKLDAEPHMGTPGARKAINALKDLEAELAAAEAAAPKVDPAEVLRDVDDLAIADAQQQRHDPNTFLAGVEDVRRGVEPLSIQGFAEEFGFIEPGERVKFSIEGHPFDQPYADYKAGVEWAAKRVAEAEPSAPKAEARAKPTMQGEEKPTGTTKFETTVETNGEKRTVSGEGALTEEKLAAAPKAEEAVPAREADEVTVMGEEPPKGGLNQDVPREALGRNWRMANWYKNLVYQFGGGTAAENALLKALGINKLPSKLSVKEKLEMLITNRNGMIREINRRFNDPIAKELKRLYKDGVTADDISLALQARAAEQRNARVERNNPEFEGYGSGLSREDAQAILNELRLDGKLQKMDKIIEMHDALRKFTQDLAVENGLISREKMDQFIAEEPDYTPFKGWAQSGDMLSDSATHADFGKPEFVRKRMGVNRNIVRKAEGRSSLAANSLLNMMADAQTMALKAADNKPARTLLDLMEAHPDYMADIAEVVPKPGEDTLTVMRDGKAENIRFKDTDAGNAMKSAFTEIADPMKRVKWLEKFERVSSLLRSVNTTLSPLFWPRALFKDVQDAIVTVYSEQGLKDSPLYGKQVAAQALKYSNPFGDTWRAAFDYLRDATPKTEEGARLKQMVADMVEQGGSAGYAFREHAQDIQAKIEEAYKRLDAMGKDKAILNTKAGRDAFMEFIHSVNDFIDIVPRAAVYRASIEAGVEPRAAAKLALEASLNLPRRGRFGNAIDAVKWYTNAGIQSAAKKGRMLRSANGRKVLAGHMALGTALALWNISVAGDKNKDGKNDYLQLPAWRKAMGLTIYSPSGETAVTIPIGFMGAFETYLGQKLGEVAYGVTSPANGAASLSSAPADIIKGFVSSQLPLGRAVADFSSPLDAFKLAVPDAAAPVLGVLTNENAFGDQIYNEPFNKEQAKSSVPRGSTPQAYKDWASWLNDNSGGHGKFAGFLDSHPETWKYLIDQYTGGVGKFVGSVAQVKNPFEGQYVVDESRASATDYYQLSPRMRQVKEAFGPTGKKDQDTVKWLKENRPVESNPRVRTMYTTVEKQLDEIKAREANLRKSKLPEDQKKLRADKIEADRQAAYARFLRVYNEVAGKQP